MISYGLAKARAMAGRDDWNEREVIKSATILWYDTEEEGYGLEIENEDDLDAEDFRAWFLINLSVFRPFPNFQAAAHLSQ